MHSSLKTAAMLASALMALSACSDDNDDTGLLDAAVPFDAGDGKQSVMLRFKAKVGSDDLTCGRTYAGQGSTKLDATPEDFRFYVQDVRLIDANGAEVPVELEERDPFQTKDVALIDFTQPAPTGECGTGGAIANTVIYGRVPVGTYTGVVFVNGVPEALNHLNPAIAAKPLQAPGANWDWLSGFRFVMAEMTLVKGGLDGGVADAGAGVAPPAHGMDAGTGGHGGGGDTSSIHVGSTECSGGPGSYSCAKSNRNLVRLTNFNPAVNSIVADLGAVFTGVDLSLGAQCHGSGANCAAGYAALGIGTDGKPTATQQVFRVE
jgi:uncharacterized repeat protein (TIGR04052 family)